MLNCHHQVGTSLGSSRSVSFSSHSVVSAAASVAAAAVSDRLQLVVATTIRLTTQRPISERFRIKWHCKYLCGAHDATLNQIERERQRICAEQYSKSGQRASDKHKVMGFIWTTLGSAKQDTQCQLFNLFLSFLATVLVATVTFI